MNLIIFDFEVFKKDTLLGCKILPENKIYQTWDKDCIRDFYYEHQNDIWIGWNNSSYDNLILQSIINRKDPYIISKNIIDNRSKPYLNIKLYWYDIMSKHMGSLKATECAAGKNISESEVDFDIDRCLTDEEKILTESYNRDDIEQTYDNFMNTFDEFQLMIDMCDEFKLDLECIHYTQAKISAKILGAERIRGIENNYIKPPLYPNLKLNNKEILNYYLNEEFKTGRKLKVNLCNVEHIIGDGGIHGAQNKIYCDEALYFDVAGYYNLVMMKYNLLPTSIPEKGKELYEFMYHEQIKLKKTNPRKRKLYKTILLSVYGAMENEYCDFYDPYKRGLVTATGQLFLCDLLEKIEPYVDLIQSNTDGVIAKLLDKKYENRVLEIVNEWRERTGFVLKLEKVYDIYQRDVNNYMYRDESGKIHVLGEAVKYYNGWENSLEKNSYMSKEPIIIHYGIVDYLLNNISPEETVQKYRDSLRMFQYICKKGTFDWVEVEETYNNETKTIKMQNVNRVFASNSPIKRVIYKRKSEGKVLKSKISNTPPNIIVYNDNINKECEELKKQIDYNYYIDRIYERIFKFLE